MHSDLQEILTGEDLRLTVSAVVDRIEQTALPQQQLEGVCFAVVNSYAPLTRVSANDSSVEIGASDDFNVTSWLLSEVLSDCPTQTLNESSTESNLSHESDSMKIHTTRLNRRTDIIYSLILAVSTLDRGKEKNVASSLSTTNNITGLLRKAGGLHKLRDEVAQVYPGLSVSSSTPYRILRIRLISSCVQSAGKLAPEELALFDETFLQNIFDLVEATRENEDECYATIELIVSLNEQFLVAQRENLVLSTLKSRHGSSKTFAENLVFIFNRAEDTRIQLQLLKLFYVLFADTTLSHFLYPNDLRVVLDVILREVPNLDLNHAALRAAYLRVLKPLLFQTGLVEMKYKLEEVKSAALAIWKAGEGDVDDTSRRVAERLLVSLDVDIARPHVVARQELRPEMQEPLSLNTQSFPLKNERLDVVHSPALFVQSTFPASPTEEDSKDSNPFSAPPSPELDPFRSHPPSESGSPTQSRFWEQPLVGFGAKPIREVSVDPFSD
ncbi:hypothetical protein M427DRAFT_54005 [Gonapodya prolifera JEL478]|uniref:SPIN90/Ldb17 leucine-rich domain-containing protein n=1 Tax=Gonapodya prolifera (strain JEL478) TaxID=1344416 RepID=A0A139ANW0_GONPJ|nr:hypothetical protein M427DRAFT_54005 [Gonapodya prolifera JEL478]|eukprot:KXS18175.1 hypothetical protein M427DRAFT_54005 [Gonapodya prolifera JEL478]